MYNSTPKFDEISYVKSFERVRSTLGASELINSREILQDAEYLRAKWSEALIRNFGKRQSSPIVLQLPSLFAR